MNEKVISFAAEHIDSICFCYVYYLRDTGEFFFVAVAVESIVIW